MIEILENIYLHQKNISILLSKHIDNVVKVTFGCFLNLPRETLLRGFYLATAGDYGNEETDVSVVRKKCSRVICTVSFNPFRYAQNLLVK